MISQQTVSWYWHRLRAMDGPEIAGRIAEKTRKLGDRKSREQLEHFRLGHVNPETTRLLPDPGAASEDLRSRIAVKASAIRDGQWRLYGWKETQMPDPPAWDWDAVHDRRAPLDEPSATLDHRHLPSGADPRSIWEINRWSEIVVLAQNAWLNGRLDDARTAQRWLWDWTERNEMGHGINWTSALEAGIRLINFTWIDTLLRACDDTEIRAAQDHLAARIMPAHTWWVWRHRSYGSSANNHLLGELAGLILATRRWPGLMHIACSAEKAWQQFQQEFVRQFAPDGGNHEQALHYHLFAWEMAWQARRVMGGGSDEFIGRLCLASRYFSALVHSNEPWDFGDCDDAEITPLTSERTQAAAEWQAWFLQEGKGESLAFWLGSPPDTKAIDKDEWILFPDSGHAVKRSGPWMARFDASPLGFGKMAAHGHLDALHVSLWHGEKAVLVDPGTGAYYSDPSLRSRLADWDAHNGPVPETTRHMPLRMGPFLWTQHHERPRLRVEDGDAVACLACEGPFIKRQIRLDAERFEVLDSVCNSLPHQILWTLAPGWRIQMTGDHRFRLIHTDDTRLQIQFEAIDPVEITPVEVEVSPRFLQTQTAQALRIRFTRALKTRITPQ